MHQSSISIEHRPLLTCTSFMKLLSMTMQILIQKILVILTIIFFASFCGTAALSEEIEVIVYEGPKSCQDEIDGDADDKKLTKVQKDCIVAFHFTASDEATGKKIESSHDLGVAPSFPVGQGKVIAGLDHGLIGLCKHSKAYIIIPPHLAYGQLGKPEQGVTGDTVLRYDVEIIDIQPPVPNDFKNIDSNKDWKISREEAQTYFAQKNQNIDIDALFKDEDTNSDGYVSWDEFSGPKGSEGPPPPMQQNRQRGQPDPAEHVAAIFQQMDTDGDGKISKSELQTAFNSMGEKMTDEFWVESDANGDGHISFAEFVGQDRGAGDEL